MKYSMTNNKMTKSKLNPKANEFYPKNINNMGMEYREKFKELDEYEEKNCNETSHIIQDEIYRKFIRDISSGKLNNFDDIKYISIILEQRVIPYDKNRWYA